MKSILLLFTLLFCLSCTPNKPKSGYDNSPTSGIAMISVDESFTPIIKQEIAVFESLYTEANIIPYYTNEVDAIQKLVNDSVRLAIVTRKLTDKETESLLALKLVARHVKFATDGIALIINPQNKDSLITIPQLKEILTGQITDWKQIYPHSKLGKIELAFDNPNSSTVRFAIDSICKGKPLSEALWAQKTNLEVIDYVAKVPNSIGVIGVSWLSERKDSTQLKFSSQVRLMSVSKDSIASSENSFKPYQAYLALGDYPLRRDVYVILTEPKNGMASGFISFLSSERGQRIVLKTGVVPATQPVRVVNIKQ